MNRTTTAVVTCLAAALTLTLSACGSNSNSATAGSAKGSPIKVGLIADVTGVAAQGEPYSVKGAQARIDAQNAQGGIDGHPIQLVVGDTTSTVAGALNAAKKLIQQDHVSAIMTWTYLYYGAADFVAQQKVPAFGGSWDSSPGWATYSTMFGSQPGTTPNTSATTYGTFFKQQGASKIAIACLNIPSAKAACDTMGASVKKAGLSVVYDSNSIGQTDSDFTSLALAIKKSGADGAYFPLPPNQSYAVASALNQQGVKLKVNLNGAGYGQDLLNSASVRSGANGSSYVIWYWPKEANNAATRLAASNLQKYSGFTGAFDFSAMGGYLDADMFIAAATKAAPDISPESITAAARTFTTYDAGGLLVHPVNWTKPMQAASGVGYGDCILVVKLDGDKFDLTTPKPVCGQTFTY